MFMFEKNASFISTPADIRCYETKFTGRTWCETASVIPTDQWEHQELIVLIPVQKTFDIIESGMCDLIKITKHVLLNFTEVLKGNRNLYNLCSS